MTSVDSASSSTGSWRNLPLWTNSGEHSDDDDDGADLRTYTIFEAGDGGDSHNVDDNTDISDYGDIDLSVKDDGAIKCIKMILVMITAMVVMIMLIILNIMIMVI